MANRSMMRTCSNNFNKQYTELPTEYHKSIRNAQRKFKRLQRTEYLATNTEFDIAIRNIKASKAIGPNEMSSVMFDKLGTCEMNFLMLLINPLLNTLQIPAIWKISSNITLLKPEKQPDKCKSQTDITFITIRKIIKSDCFTVVQQIFQPSMRDLNEKRQCQRTILVTLDFIQFRTHGY